MRTAVSYRVELLENPAVTPEGVTHGPTAGRALLPWSEVCWAIAAEIGEPEGVRTIVFDLLTRRGDDGDDDCWQVRRLDAEPGEDAIALARLVEHGLGAERKVSSIKSLATDGIPTRRYPDLLSFEEDALAELIETLV